LRMYAQLLYVIVCDDWRCLVTVVRTWSATSNDFKQTASALKVQPINTQLYTCRIYSLYFPYKYSFTTVGRV